MLRYSTRRGSESLFSATDRLMVSGGRSKDLRICGEGAPFKVVIRAERGAILGRVLRLQLVFSSCNFGYLHCLIATNLNFIVHCRVIV